ncbi:MAG: transcriptional regulator [Rhizobiaceae bacterium]|nr:transcriptional regulator [Rhizobiaceae bacterium]
MTTLKDLSHALGLSVTQVSRALNGHSDVSAATRERVVDAAKRLNYMPNVSARRLVSGRSGTVGLVFRNRSEVPADTLFVETTCGLSEFFAEHDLQFMLHVGRLADDEIKVYRRLVDSRTLDGFVILNPAVDDRRIAFLREREVPFVVHGRAAPDSAHPYFDIDNEEVAHRLTRHLIERGHRRIAFINGLRSLTFVEARQRGYARALSEAGIVYDETLHVAVEMTESAGLVESVRLVAHTAERPTAVICGNTRIAKGVYHAVEATGLSIPEDVSVVAHDDLLFEFDSERFNPPLTVTASALSESWKPMATFLARAIEGGHPLAEMQEVGRTVFIERASVATI